SACRHAGADGGGGITPLSAKAGEEHDLVRAAFTHGGELFRVGGADHHTDIGWVNIVPLPAPIGDMKVERRAGFQLQVLQVAAARVAGFAEHDDALSFI